MDGLVERQSEGLDALEKAARHDLARLNHPPANWVPPRRGPDGRWRYGIDERLRLRRGDAVAIHHGDDADAAPVRGRLVGATTRRVTVEVDGDPVVIGRDGVWAVAPG